MIVNKKFLSNLQKAINEIQFYKYDMSWSYMHNLIIKKITNISNECEVFCRCLILKDFKLKPKFEMTNLFNTSSDLMPTSKNYSFYQVEINIYIHKWKWKALFNCLTVQRLKLAYGRVLKGRGGDISSVILARDQKQIKYFLRNRS